METILFAAVTAEEKGLLGSTFLANVTQAHGETVVANLNINMPLTFTRTQGFVAFGAEHSSLGTLARNRGHRIVAEGIETPDHLESVLELRYDAGQGYLFGRAEPTLDRQPIDLFALLSTTGQEQPAA